MIQGQLGNLEVMLNKLLDYGFNTPDGTPMVQNQLTRYLMDDSDGSFRATIRKNLLLRTQNRKIYIGTTFELVFSFNKKNTKSVLFKKSGL